MDLDSTEVVSLIDSAGPVVDWALSGNDDFSNKTRKRAYRPRVDVSFRALDDSAQLRAAWILTRELLKRHPEAEEPLRAKLSAGASKSTSSFPARARFMSFCSPREPNTTPTAPSSRSSRKAKQSIAVVDPYLDGTIFMMLATSSAPALSVKLLTAKVPSDFALEGGKFRTEFSRFAIEARKTSDFHDRLIIVDDSRCWHIGASIKDSGPKTFMINELEVPRTATH